MAKRKAIEVSKPLMPRTVLEWSTGSFSGAIPNMVRYYYCKARGFESLKSIADRLSNQPTGVAGKTYENNLAWERVAQLNFGTVNKREINWYLENLNGCGNRLSRGNKNYCFHPDDDRPWLWIPIQANNVARPSGGFFCIFKRAPGGYLTVNVKDSDDHDIPGARVNIRGKMKAWFSGDSGSCSLGRLKVGKYTVAVFKKGFAPKAGQEPAPVEQEVEIKAKDNKSITVKLTSVQKVTRITAKLPATIGMRDNTKKLNNNDNTLTASTSNKIKLAENAPVVLVRGCKDVQLTAVTDPAETPVDWKIEKNDTDRNPPTLEVKDNGYEAVLKTDRWGSFAVTAELGGHKIVWNVVFVWVNVKTRTSNISKRSNLFADNGSDANYTSFKSGEFAAGQYAWEGKVKVKLKGGGNDKKMGVNKVELHVLQNGVADTLTGQYKPAVAGGIGGTCLEQPKGGLPVVDATGAGSPFITPAAGCAKITPNNTAESRVYWTGDSPCGGFANEHKNTNQPLESISGENSFVSLVASTSQDAPNSVIVHARTSWAADYSGDVTYPYAAPHADHSDYTANGAKVTGGRSFSTIASARGGQDAQEAGYEVIQPRFNDGVDYVWTP